MKFLRMRTLGLFLLLFFIVSCQNNQTFFPTSIAENPDGYVITGLDLTSESLGMKEESSDRRFSILVAEEPSPKLLGCVFELVQEGYLIHQHQNDSGVIFTIDQRIDPYELPVLCGGSSIDIPLSAGTIVQTRTEPIQARLNFEHLLLPEDIEQDLYDGATYFLVATSGEGSVYPDRTFSPSIIPFGQGPGNGFYAAYFIIRSTIERMIEGEEVEFFLFKQLAINEFERIPMEVSALPTELPAYVIGLSDFHLIAKRFDEMFHPAGTCHMDQVSAYNATTFSSIITYVPATYNPYDFQMICGNFPSQFAQSYSIPMLDAQVQVLETEPVDIEVNVAEGYARPDPAIYDGILDGRNYILVAELFTIEGWPLTREFLPLDFEYWQNPESGTFQYNLFTISQFLAQSGLVNLFFLRQVADDQFEIIPNNLVFVP